MVAVGSFIVPIRCTRFVLRRWRAAGLVRALRERHEAEWFVLGWIQHNYVGCEVVCGWAGDEGFSVL